MASCQIDKSYLQMKKLFFLLAIALTVFACTTDSVTFNEFDEVEALEARLSEIYNIDVELTPVKSSTERRNRDLYCNLDSDSFGGSAHVDVETFGNTSFYYLVTENGTYLISDELATGFCSNWNARMLRLDDSGTGSCGPDGCNLCWTNPDGTKTHLNSCNNDVHKK